MVVLVMDNVWFFITSNSLKTLSIRISLQVGFWRVLEGRTLKGHFYNLMFKNFLKNNVILYVNEPCCVFSLIFLKYQMHIKLWMWPFKVIPSKIFQKSTLQTDSKKMVPTHSFIFFKVSNSIYIGIQHIIC